MAVAEELEIPHGILEMLTVMLCKIWTLANFPKFLVVRPWIKPHCFDAVLCSRFCFSVLQTDQGKCLTVQKKNTDQARIQLYKEPCKAPGDTESQWKGHEIWTTTFSVWPCPWHNTSWYFSFPYKVNFPYLLCSCLSLRRTEIKDCQNW